MKIYGNDKTHLTMTKRAQAFYDCTDPITIEEIETDDGYLYNVSGVLERDCMTEDELNAALESMSAYWYAVLEDADDNDWGYGSFDYEEAIKMARAIGKDARIAVICEGEDPICERIILQEDF